MVKRMVVDKGNWICLRGHAFLVILHRGIPLSEVLYTYDDITILVGQNDEMF
jgi:hypothetical protein